MGKKAADPETWHAMLSGEMPGLIRSRRFFAHIPSTPRCKLCNSPFGKPGGLLMSAHPARPVAAQPPPVQAVHPAAAQGTGGAELEITVLFADVRGSTGLAEGASAGRLLRSCSPASTGSRRRRSTTTTGSWTSSSATRPWHSSSRASPVRCTRRRVEAARDLLRATGNDGPEPWLPIGIGIDTGVAYVGVVGEGDAIDFTALGDPVNTASRLSGLAAQGQILMQRRDVTGRRPRHRPGSSTERSRSAAARASVETFALRA